MHNQEETRIVESVVEIAEAVRSGRVKATEILEKYIQKIEQHNASLNAFAHLDFTNARDIAAGIDVRVARGEDPGPLAGVPFGVKDLHNCAGMPTSFGCAFYSGGPNQESDSLFVARLRNAGAVPVGKTTTAEMGFAGDCHTTACGTTRNPWDLSKTPGGSSGGSAAAVASGMLPLATGCDGGGSVRVPAAFTGLVGLKPSHGRVPNDNGSSENSCFSTLTTSVKDLARCMDIISGPDDRDRKSLPETTTGYEAAIETLDVAGLKAVWSEDLGFATVDREVVEITYQAARKLIQAASLETYEMPVRFTNLIPAMMNFYVPKLRKMFADQGFLPDRYEELADTTKIVFDMLPSASEDDEEKHRNDVLSLEAEVAAFFREADILLCPTAACPAFNAEGPFPTVIDGRDASGTFDAPLTPLANYCWNPSITIPAGVTSKGLPVGLLVTCRRHRDDIALRLARLMEIAFPWLKRAPGY